MPQYPPPAARPRRRTLLCLLVGLLAASLPRAGAASPPDQTVSVGLLKDINPGASSSSPRDFVQLGDKLLFTAAAPATGAEIWVTDGTEAGTQLVKDVVPGPEDSIFITPVALGNLAIFVRMASNGFEVWASDGTAAGTRLLRTQANLTPTSWNLAVLDGAAYFLVVTNTGPIIHQLWRTDGTAAGTSSVAQIALPASVTFARAGAISAINGMLYVLTERTGGEGYVQLRSNGSNLEPIDIFGCDSPYSCLENPIIPFGDGAATLPPGTQRLTLYRPSGRQTLDLAALGFGRVSKLFADGETILFGGVDTDGNAGIWRTDATAAGTQLVAPIPLDAPPPPHTAVNMGDFTRAHGLIYFILFTSFHQREIWQTDGTAAGTRKAADFWPSYTMIFGGELKNLGDRLYFSGYDGFETYGRYGNEMWTIAGRDAAPQLLGDINPGGARSRDDHSVRDMADLPSGIVWAAASPGAGMELRLLPRAAEPYLLPPDRRFAASGFEGQVQVRFGNQGLADSEPQTMTLRLTAGMALTQHTIGLTPTVDGDTTSWALGALPTGERLAELTLALPEAEAGTLFTATLRLGPSGAEADIVLQTGYAVHLPLMPHAPVVWWD